MHHRAPADRDGHLPPEPAVGSDHRVLHGASPAEVVRDGVQFACIRIDEGVPGVPTADRTVEVTHIDGVQLRRQLGRRRAAFDEREKTTAETDDVRVGRRSVQRRPMAFVRVPPTQRT